MNPKQIRDLKQSVAAFEQTAQTIMASVGEVGGNIDALFSRLNRMDQLVHELRQRVEAMERRMRHEQHAELPADAR